MPVSPALAEDLAATVADLYEAAEGVLLATLRRALAEGIDSPAWVGLKLASVGNMQAAIEEVLAALRLDADTAVARALSQAYERGQQAALAELGALGVGQTAAAAAVLPTAPVVDRLAAAVINDTGPVYLRILRTTMDTYRDVIGRAAAAPALGAQTRRQAAQAALDAFADRGVKGFIDSRGRSWELRSYVEMAMRSAVGRAAIEAHSDRLGAAGVDLVIVSQAPEECPLCRPWERKILARSGRAGARTIDVEHATEDGTAVTVEVAGSLEEARAAGLLHPNCRHSISAYLPGVSRTPAPQASRGTYEDSQQQRYLERQVRRWRRREQTALDEQEAKAVRARVRAYQARIRELTAATGLPRKSRREQPEGAR